MKRTITFVIVLLSTSHFAFAQSKAETATAAVSPEKRQRAERSVLRALQKFGQTLNFEGVYQEMFINDEAVKREDMSSSINKFVDKKVQQEIDPNVLKNGFFKAHKIIWLLSLCYAMDNEKFEDMEKSLVPKLDQRQRDLYRRLKAEQKFFLRSQNDVLIALSIGDTAEKMFSEFIALKAGKDLQDTFTISRFDSVNPCGNNPNPAQYKNFYHIVARINDKPVPLSFIVVEESGEMKILSAKLCFASD